MLVVDQNAILERYQQLMNEKTVSETSILTALDTLYGFSDEEVSTLRIDLLERVKDKYGKEIKYLEQFIRESSEKQEARSNGDDRDHYEVGGSYSV